ncbi:MAG: Gfo/Idh/MocA family oxidoreductase [Ectothiorhodospiraceae bacterium]|nr:Gfo/Idh/MocA family oxidoreductase [Ectothiorhodospiraceae bacterium]
MSDAFRPVVWGVLGVARIATERVIPGMQASPLCDVRAIASRDAARAAAAAHELGLARAHGSYEALLADPEIEAVYIPLPNHMHVEWSIRALEAGKHVLCEKPLAVEAREIAALVAARERTGLVCEEAFMVRDHPQWARVHALIDDGVIGEVTGLQGTYCYFGDDPADIRHQPEYGGGSLYDIGCYCTAVSRLVLRDEPRRALALLAMDPAFGVERTASAILQFPRAQASFFCSMRSARYQMLQVMGTAGWLRVEVPYAHPPTLAARIVVGRGHEAPGTEPTERITFEPVDQYRLQGERISRLVRGETARQWPLDDAVRNTRAIEAMHRSWRSGTWETI